MPYTETGKEKQKREAYMKANKEHGVRQEAERDYKMFGTTEQNIPAVDTMGGVTGMKKGGRISKADMQKAGFYDKDKTKSERQAIVSKVTTKPQRVAIVEKAFSTKNMKAGGSVSSASKRADGCCTKGKTKGKMV